MIAWQPTASIETLKARAVFLANIRAFFAAREVWEVQTPLLGRYAGTDLHLDPFVVQSLGSLRYLQTSPEYAMKRLLAAGSGSIYQLCPAFRQEEQGRRHNPEFTILEWYRVEWGYEALMQEVDALCQFLLGTPPATIVTYEALFQEHYQISAAGCTLEALTPLVRQHAHYDGPLASKDEALLLLLSEIEPKFGQEAPVFLTEYPPTQAVLAELVAGEQGLVAQRFELYYKGYELANGFQELRDPIEQVARFRADNQLRVQSHKPSIPIDTALLAALEYLPRTSGVAMGVDRMFMLHMGLSTIDQVLAFSFDRV